MDDLILKELSVHIVLSVLADKNNEWSVDIHSN